jgi:WD40 repeat protein
MFSYTLPGNYTSGLLPIGVLSDNKWILGADDIDVLAEKTHLYSGNLQSGKVTKRWVESNGQICFGQGSRNGKYLAAWSHTNPYTTHLGLVAANGESIQWIIEPKGNKPMGMSGGCTGNFVPSEDGKYIAMACGKHGVLMVDVVNKKILWVACYLPEKRNSSWNEVPLDPGSVNSVAFTPDGKMIYIGGSGAVVLGLKADTGEVVSRWDTPAPVHEERPHSIFTMAASPDGRFMAAGTDHNGFVFLFSTKDGQRHVLNRNGTREMDLVTFSPDSKRLAACTGNFDYFRKYHATKEIKIWKLPDEAK